VATGHERVGDGGVSSLRRMAGAFDPAERRRLVGLGGVILLLHVLGIALVALYAPAHPVLGGLAVLAYSFGLRHAFDADHIAAIDNTTRKLLSQGDRPLGAGFFFSLGHATVVFVLCVSLAVAGGVVHAAIPTLQLYGGSVGGAVSGVFLWLIGALNLVVLVRLLCAGRAFRAGRCEESALEERLQDRGLLIRLFSRPLRMVRRDRQMYPVGLLFGLGFDTATEVGLLAVTAGAASGRVPAPAVVGLPILFAAGMSLMDTADGVFMTKAYRWAFSSPERKLFYNTTVTGLSVAVALLIGSVELGQVMAAKLRWDGGFWGWLQGLDLGSLGYAVVGLFVGVWAVALVIWRLRQGRQAATPSAAGLA
jgi:high-affinity nickel-transport protein